MRGLVGGLGLWAVVVVAGCGGAGNGNANSNTNGNTNDNGNGPTALQACERYVAHLVSLTCRDPNVPTPSCAGVELLDPEQLPDYDCLIANVFCDAEGNMNTDGAGSCL